MQPRKHSKSGIISLLIAVTAGLLVLAVFIGLFVPESGTYATQKYNKFLFIVIFIVAPIFHLVGLTTGIIGAFDVNSKKIFAVLGIIFNRIAPLAAAVFWILIIALGIAVLNSGGVWM